MEKKTKTKMLKQLELLATIPPAMKAPPPPVEEEDEPLQASKEIPEKPCELPKKEKPKRVLNEAQLEGMRKGRESLALKNAEKKAQKEIAEAERKKQFEEKVVNKAISIKKKLLKQEILLDDISDDETPIEEIKQKVVAKKQVAPEPPEPPAPPTPKATPKAPKAFVNAVLTTPAKAKPTFIFV